MIDLNSESCTVKVQLSWTTYKAECAKGNLLPLYTRVVPFCFVAVDSHKRKFEFDIPVSEEATALLEVLFISSILSYMQ